jgi:hypothetical protein
MTENISSSNNHITDITPSQLKHYSDENRERFEKLIMDLENLAKSVTKSLTKPSDTVV